MKSSVSELGLKCIAQEHNNIPNGDLTGVKHIDTSDTIFSHKHGTNTNKISFTKKAT